MQQTKKFKMADAISPYLAVSCGLIMFNLARVLCCWFALGFWRRYTSGIEASLVDVQAWYRIIPSNTGLSSLGTHQNDSIINAILIICNAAVILIKRETRWYILQVNNSNFAFANKIGGDEILTDMTAFVYICISGNFVARFYSNCNGF